MDAHNQLVAGLKAALIDERTTAVFYAQMRDISRNYAGVEAFAEARKDELDHAREITELLEDLTGVTPPEAAQPVTPPSFGDYCQGLARAIQGERHAFMEYSNLINISPFARVNKALDEIRSDEEVHLAKFCKLYEIMCQANYYQTQQVNDPAVEKK
ncbi:hypothetical protein Desca_2485 [Desulfotomaculum nigrificans CO-1-SRB]|uniref:Rubrerythrin diiron-binding domain-containing protein n=1 Tax=Desulfotomaculum nigrificans (strain DSM 14880 / VKM B-2319 / CO-1-SRB) TaxID=868595 RepID=F6B4D5_DESCC|nr:ferritin-like domain-containing protein [Desulfotomaculum nigrificans]AEF95312.1 hypothetical protein Desca_2485 [Desulfotomaculum nigrificans CO-1-SRB]